MKTLTELNHIAELARYNYYLKRISREEASELVAPYIEALNKGFKENALKYNKKIIVMNIDDFLER